MPIIKPAYKISGIFKNGHFATIYSAKIRRVLGVKQFRERIDLADGDFIDVDWSFAQGERASRKVCVLLHGLEGNAQRPYMLGQVKILNQNGFDCACVNLRGCSGEVNRAYRSYHSGATGDLAEILDFFASEKTYTEYYLCGFSLGGNLILKYMGEDRKLPQQLRAAAAISAPVHLYGSLTSLSARQNWVYRWNFLKDLRRKYRGKIDYYPDQMSHADLQKIKSLQLFDELYTAPANGFEDAMEYYSQSSSLPLLKNINLPTFLLNARNDSFLDAACYPFREAYDSKTLHLEIPKYGGHVGFYSAGAFYYSERRTLKFFKEKRL